MDKTGIEEEAKEARGWRREEGRANISHGVFFMATLDRGNKEMIFS